MLAIAPNVLLSLRVEGLPRNRRQGLGKPYGSYSPYRYERIMRCPGEQGELERAKPLLFLLFFLLLFGIRLSLIAAPAGGWGVAVASHRRCAAAE